MADKLTISAKERGNEGVEEHWIRGVEECGTGPEEEHEQGVKSPRGARSKNRRTLTQGVDLNLSLRGSVERASSTWAGLDEEAKSRIYGNRSAKSDWRGAGSPFDRYTS